MYHSTENDRKFVLALGYANSFSAFSDIGASRKVPSHRRQLHLDNNQRLEHSFPCHTLAMATQRLALNFQRALRNRNALKAIQPLRRYANPVEQSRTECTTLSNGLTVPLGAQLWIRQR